MRKVIISNSALVDDTYKSALSSVYNSGVALSLISDVSFSPNDLAVIGEIAEEKTELKKVDTLTGKTQLNLASALNFSHGKDTPVYKVAWDFVVIEGRSSSAGVFAALSQSPIQWDKKDTIYYHPAGTSTWQYRYRFYNSAIAVGGDGEYSEYSPTIDGTGYSRDMAGYMIREIRKVLQDPERKLFKDIEIMRWLNEAQDIIQGVRPNWWFLRAEDNSVTTVAGTRRYGFPAGIGNLGKVDVIEYNYNDGTVNQIYALRFLPYIEFEARVRNNLNSAGLLNDWVGVYTLREPDSTYPYGSFEVDQTPANTGRGTFKILYYKDIPDLDDVADTTPIPIPSILEAYAIAQGYKVMGGDANDARADRYEDFFWGPADQAKGRRRITGIALLEQLSTAQKRPQGQPRSLFNFRGQKSVGRYFDNRSTLDRDTLHENNF